MTDPGNLENDDGQDAHRRGGHEAPGFGRCHVFKIRVGNATLAPQVGLLAPIKPTRGQVLITERLKPFLDYPTNKCRQTKEGSVQLGSTAEDVGYDDGTSADKIEWLARRADVSV
ncbi:hypothetical protein [Martelella sp. AMO21009]